MAATASSNGSATLVASGEVLLRALDPDRDGEALHAIWGDEESCRYMTGPAHGAVAQTVALLKQWTAGNENTSWAIVERPDGEALGRVALYTEGRDVWEAACMVVPAARGRGLAARALARAIDHVFEKHGARRIVADIDPDNAASIRTFETLGFAREGLLRANWKTHIGVRDSVIMGLVDTDPRPWRGEAL